MFRAVGRRGAVGCAQGAKRPERGALPAERPSAAEPRLESVKKILTQSSVPLQDQPLAATRRPRVRFGEAERSAEPQCRALRYRQLVPADEVVLGSTAAVIAHLLDEKRGDRRWFRGQGCDTRSLVPSLYRKLDDTSPANVLAVEQRLITRFRQRSLPLWPEGYPQSQWEQLFAMQHYGVPTRLLDWSENALAGLYFASDHDPSRCECGGTCRPTLWVLDPVALNQSNPRLDGMPVSILASSDLEAAPWEPGTLEAQFPPSSIAMYGTHNSLRISAQQGTFTVSGKDITPLEGTAPASEPGVLMRIVVDLTHDQIRADLRTLGISPAVIYADLPSLARDIADTEIF